MKKYLQYLPSKERLRKAGDAVRGTAIVGLIGGGAGAAAGLLGGLPVNVVIDGAQGDDIVAGLGDTVKNTSIASSVGAMVGANAARMRSRHTTGGAVAGAALGAGAGLVTSAAQALLTNRGTKQDAELIDAVAEREGMSSEALLGGLVAAGVLTTGVLDDVPDRGYDVDLGPIRTGHAGPERKYLRG